jgi:Hint domain
MPNNTLTGSHASFAITVDNYTLTNLGTVGSNAVGTGLTVSGTADIVVNAGTLGGANYAVDASQGLSLTNQTGGRITSNGNAIYIYGATGSVTNAGVITGLSDGIQLYAGGYVGNQHGGAITGTNFDGVQIAGGTGTVTNAGNIAGHAVGIALNDGGTVTNTGSIGGEYAVYLLAGGVVTNQSSGTISGTINGHEVGIEALSAASTIDNAATISSQYTGIELDEGGVVTNAVGGTITANVFAPIDISGATGTVVNYGSIVGGGASFAGVELEAGGAVTNQSGGTIIGGGAGIAFLGTAAAASNAGYIQGHYSGIGLFAGGSVTNLTWGVITSATYGIIAKYAGITVTNAGSISGGTDAVRLAAGYANLLVVDPGASFTGTVTGGNTIGATAVSTLELASSATTGTLNGLGTQFIDFGTITIDSGATWKVNGTVGAGVTLINSGDVVAPLTLDAGAVLTNTSGGAIGGTGVGYAVTGVGAGPATVVNAGSIAGTGSRGVGIYLSDGGKVANSATAALISGSFDAIIVKGAAGTVSNYGTIMSTAAAGVALYEAGSVTNGADGTTTALISGHLDGVDINGAAGTVANYGTITGTLGTGIDLFDGGSVTNSATAALITGGFDAIIVKGAAGTVSNDGTITSTAAAGIALYQAGSVTNGAAGTTTALISGHLDGVDINGAAGTVGNYGTITGTLGTGIDLFDGGSVTNQSGGTIASGTSGSFGIAVAGAAGTVSNTGVITGVVAGIQLLAGGHVGNYGGGTISGGGDGVTISGVTATLVNAGSIFGTGYGVRASQGISLTNQSGGTIAGTSTGLYVGGGLATVVNAGLIAGQGVVGVDVQGGGAVTNLSGGTITGYSDAVALVLNPATLVNAGLITVSSAKDGVILDAGGAVTNQAGGTIASADRIAIRANNAAVTVTVVNAGIISAYTEGVYLEGGGAVTNQSGGTISQSGTVQGTGAFVFTGAVVAEQNATVDNAGSISGQYQGVYLLVGGTVINQIGGTISGGRAIHNKGTLGTVINAGNVVGVEAVEAGDEGTVTNLSTGTITSTTTFGVGVDVSSGTLDNAGDITGGIAAVDVTGSVITSGTVTIDLGVLINESTGTISQSGGYLKYNPAGHTFNHYEGVFVFGAHASVTNAGSISGLNYGVDIDGSNTVTNLSGGRISSALNTGVYIASAGTLINAGNISGGSYAVRIGGPRAAIADQGEGRVIVDPGATFIGKVDGYSEIGNPNVSVLELASGASAGTLSGLGSQFINFTQITIDAGATWTVSGSIAAGYTVTDAGTLTNTGSLASPVTLDAGAVLINTAGGTIAGAAVTIAVQAIGTATVTNAGDIAGSTYGIDLTDGGTVTNQSGGTISATGLYGVVVATSTGTVTNAGLITGASDGVLLDQGGAVSNQSGGTIESAATGSSGIAINGAPGTVSNAGMIAGAINGVLLLAGGTVANQTGSTIEGTGTASVGIAILGVAASVLNAGAVNGSVDGVYADQGLNLTNQSTGTIAGAGQFGVYVRNGIGTLTNAGAITGGSDGIVLAQGGSVTNQSGGTIESAITGSFGVAVGGAAGTVTNAGGIAGATDSVLFSAGFANRLIVDPGATFTGTVNGGNTIGGTSTSTLELASGTSAGTLSGIGSQFINFAAITIDAGAAWTLAGANTIAAGTMLTELSGASLIDTGTLENDGTIVLDPSTLTVAALTGSGLVTIDAGSTLEAQGTVAAGATLAFAGSGAYVHFDTPDSVAGSVTNFAVGETIDLTGIDPTTVDFSGGTLNFAGGSFALSLGSGTGVQAIASADGAMLSVLCFCAGTRILTPSGEVTVESLSVGDLVVTASGAAEPLVWIGTGQVMVTRGRRSAATPVIVRRSALADNVPNVDLRVTKGHSLLIDGVLIPVEFLVNHRSILWDDHAREVTIYHLELPSHDVLVANGAPAESYRDDGNRWLFQNANTGWDQPPKRPFAPVLTGGPIVDAVWWRLLQRSGSRPGVPLTDEPDLHLLVDGTRVNPTVQRDGRYVFKRLRVGAEFRVISRAGSPAELGLARDPRALGVAIRQIQLWQGARLRVLDAACSALERGFHDYESDNNFRWTDGDALLPATLFDGLDGKCDLELFVESTARYPLFAEAA